MRTGSSCRLSGPREANAGRAKVRNRVIAGDGDRTGGVLTSPVRSRDFERIDGRPGVVELRSISDNRDWPLRTIGLGLANRMSG